MTKMCDNRRLYPNGDRAWDNVKYEDRFKIIGTLNGKELDWKTGRPILLENEEWD